MAMVFISYAKDDNHRVDALEAALDASGVSAWRDKSQLPPGAEHWRQIEREIEHAKAVVLCGSGTSLKNPNVLDEVTHAKRKKVPIVTVAFEAPRSLPVPIELGRNNFENLSEWRGDVLDPSFLKILSAIGEAAGDEKLKRRHPDWIAEQREKKDAQEQAAAAKTAADVTARRMADEARAKELAALDKSKLGFRSAQEKRFRETAIAKDVKLREEILDSKKLECLRAEEDLSSALGAQHISVAATEPGWRSGLAGCLAIPAGLFLGMQVLIAAGWFGYNLFSGRLTARYLEIGVRAELYFMGIPALILFFAWLLTRDVTVNRLAFDREGLRKRAEDARKSMQRAEREFVAAKAAADKAWEPFQRAIDEFESKRPST